MANYLTTDTELTSVANAIRTKGGTSASLTFPSGFISAIQNISGGGIGNWEDISDAFSMTLGTIILAISDGEYVLLLCHAEDVNWELTVVDETYIPYYAGSVSVVVVEDDAGYINSYEDYEAYIENGWSSVYNAGIIFGAYQIGGI